MAGKVGDEHWERERADLFARPPVPPVRSSYGA